MKRCMRLMVLIFSLMFVVGLGYMGLFSQDAEKDLLIAESIDQLPSLIEKILKDNDLQKLEEIKKSNLELVNGNLFLTVQKCNTLLDEGIKNELSEEREKINFKIARVIAELYQLAYNNSYLLDKVDLFGKWTKDEKEKYLEAMKLYTQGEEERYKYNFEVSMNSFNQSLLLCREIGYKEGEAISLKSIGLIHWTVDDYEKALQLYKEELAIFRKIKDRIREAQSLLHIGEVYWIQNSNEKARQTLEEGLTICRELNYRAGLANCLIRIASVYLSISENEKARQRYEYGLAIFREIKDQVGEANTLRALGQVYFWLAEYQKARRSYEESLAIFREIKDRNGEAYSLEGVGDVHVILSENEKARQSYEDALYISREIKNRSLEAYSLLKLGQIHRNISEYEKARQIYEKSLAIFREIKDQFGEAYVIQFLGDLHLQLSEKEKARQNYEAGLVIHQRIKHRLGEAKFLWSLGDIYKSLSEYKKAHKSYEKALVIFREVKDRVGEANTLQSLGDLRQNLCEYKKALKLYEETLSIQKEIGERNGMILTYNGLGRTHEAMKNLSAAEKEYINSIVITETIWEEIKREEFKSSFLSSQIGPYESLIHLLFKQDKGTQAFHYAERSKARSFLYLLGNKRIDIKKGASQELAQKEEELRQQIVRLTKQIMDNEEKEPGRRSSSTQINNELLQSKQTHSEILERIKLQCPEYASMISVNPLSLEDIQNLIRQTGNTVFLEYYITPDAAYLWLLDGKDIFSYKININNQTLAQKVREYAAMIATPDAFGVPTLEFQAQELYNLLLKPVENHLAGKTRIAVIPHGVLHYLPFEALMNNGKFLVEQDTSFFYLPSASVYKYCRDKNPLKKEQLIALGNPDGSLPFSEQEVKELKGFTKLEPKIFTGEKATETNARIEGSSADILHFSCHGIFDSLHPMYSALKLAGDDKEDGNLEVQDIFQLELKPAYLVTLSACETNVGSIKSGDEIVVMSRAFIYAGTPSVLASLWKVDDYYTEKLMVSFYRALKDTDKITALHLARKEMMEKYGKRHPFYWAPFVLIGDFR